MIYNVKQEFEENLKLTDWMDSLSKKMASEKVFLFNFKINY